MAQEHFLAWLRPEADIWIPDKCNNTLGFYFQIILQTLLVGDLLSMWRNRAVLKVKWRSLGEQSSRSFSASIKYMFFFN